MLEVFLLCIIAVFVPFFGSNPLVIILALGAWACVSMPGAWLIFRGAPPFVPTPQKTLHAMLDLAKLRPGEKAYDLGCGDGRIVRAAAAQGAQAVGYEYSVPTYLVARARSLGHARTRILHANFWKQDLSDADVVFCYLLTEPMRKFRAKIWPMLKPGTRVVSHCFKMPDATPAAHEDDAYLYIKD